MARRCYRGHINDITLRLTTGDSEVDALLRSVVGAFEAAFPGQVRGYYLAGSYAKGTSTATSELAGRTRADRGEHPPRQAHDSRGDGCTIRVHPSRSRSQDSTTSGRYTLRRMDGAWKVTEAVREAA